MSSSVVHNQLYRMDNVVTVDYPGLENYIIHAYPVPKRLLGRCSNITGVSESSIIKFANMISDTFGGQLEDGFISMRSVRSKSLYSDTEDSGFSAVRRIMSPDPALEALLKSNFTTLQST